jgi:hypothetical protein
MSLLSVLSFSVRCRLNSRVKLLVLLGEVLVGMLNHQRLAGVHLRNDGLSLEHAEFLLGVLDSRLNLALVGEISVGMEAVPGSSDGVLSEVVTGHSVAVSQQLSVEIQSKGLVCGHFRGWRSVLWVLRIGVRSKSWGRRKCFYWGFGFEWRCFALIGFLVMPS